jgi:hypothetical protein
LEQQISLVYEMGALRKWYVVLEVYTEASILCVGGRNPEEFYGVDVFRGKIDNGGRVVLSGSLRYFFVRAKYIYTFVIASFHHQ